MGRLTIKKNWELKSVKKTKKRLKRLYNPSLLSCINKVVDHLQVEKEEKTRLTKTSYNLNIVLTKTFFTVIRLFPWRFDNKWKYSLQNVIILFFIQEDRK